MKTTTLVMCVVAALAVFTSSVNAQFYTATRETRIDVEGQLAGCNVNGLVQLTGKINLNTKFFLGSRNYLDAEVRPDVLAASSNSYPALISGPTKVSQRLVYFTNGLATVEFPCSVRAERVTTLNPFGNIRLELQYTAHLTFKQDGVTVTLEGASYDNFHFVCL